MSEDSIAEQMQATFGARADQPLGDVDFVSGQTLARFSRASIAAAENLLDKAERALAGGDEERAARLIDRAAHLDYDRHEETTPAAFAVTMLLFCAVTDVLERAPEGDSRWLDAAVETMTSADTWGQSTMRDTLLAIRQDYAIEPQENRTIRNATATVTPRPELRDATLTSGELGEAVTSVLQITLAYRAALEATGT